MTGLTVAVRREDVPPPDNRSYFARWLGGLVDGALQGTMQQAAELAKPFPDLVHQSATTVHPIFVPLRHAISTLCSELQKGQKLSDKNCQLIEELLSSFLQADYDDYFKKCWDGEGDNVIKPQCEKLRQFLQAVEAKNIDLRGAMHGLDAINVLYHLELGPVGTVWDNFVHSLVEKGASLVGNLLTTPPRLPSDEHTAILNRFFTQAPRPSTPRPLATEADVRAAANLLIDNTVYGAVGRAVLGQDLKTQAQVFAHIQNTYLSWWGRKWAACRYYMFLIPTRFYVQGVVNHLMDYLTGMITSGEADAYQSHFRSILRFFHGQLVTVNGAYGFVASHTEPYATIGAMMDDRLQHPKLNRGLNPTQINGQFVSAFLDQFIPRFAWSSRISTLLQRLRFSRDSKLAILNLMIVPLTTIISWLQRGLFFPIEWGLNKLVVWTLKQFIAKAKLIEEIRDKSRQALVGQNYAHAVNEFFRDFLKNALDQMTAPSQEAAKSTQPLGQATLKELEGLFTNLLIALQLHKEQDLGQLKGLIEGGTLLDKLTHGLSELTGRTVNPSRAIVKAIASQLSAVSQDIVNKAQFYEFLHITLQNLNATFDNQPDVSEEEQRRVEGEMFDLLSTIITKAARDALHAQLNAEPPRAANPFMDELTGLFGQFADQCSGDSVAKHQDDLRRKLQGLLTRAEGSDGLDRAQIDHLKRAMASKIKALDETQIETKIALLKAPVEPLSPQEVAPGVDLNRWEDQIFSAVRGFLASRAQEIPGLATEPFLLRKFVSGLFLWFATGKVE